MKGEKRPYEMYFKRPLDFICALLMIIIFWWLFLVIAILVRIKLGSPVLFCQERPGKDEQLFKLYKFRTMTNEKDENGQLLSDEQRLTKFGQTLRSTSLDEIPEIINILKGDLSLCGPRPLLPRDVACMNTEQHKRHKVRPGLTGLSQCTGRNALNWDEKLSMDIEYVEHLCFALDCRIILRTIIKVLKREDVSFENGMNMDLKEWNNLKMKMEEGR